ncbi:MAG: hypothetical protein ACREOF_16385 [Gemmatimonadales bacterium]
MAYPFLAAVYSVLALAAANGGDLERPGHLARPLAVALGVAAGAWLLSRLVSRDPHRRGIVTFIAVVVCVSYGYWQALLLDLPPLDRLATDAVALPAAAAAIVAIGWSARSGRRTYAGVTRYLNVVMGLLVGIALVGLASAPRSASAVAGPPVPVLPSMSAGGERPHVFVIVPDKYTGSRSLLAHYAYDNGAFERALEARGLIVARKARANYVQTSLALAAMLNWDYVDSLIRGVDPREQRRDLLYPLIEDNRTARALQALGYRFVFLPTAFAPTAANRFADLQLPPPGVAAHEFEAAWLRTTVLYPLLGSWCDRCTGGLVWNAHESAGSIDWKFEQLERLAASDEPLFVLAHLPVPHEPYVYDAACRPTRPYWPLRDEGPNAGRVKAAYLAQLECVNRKLLRLVDSLKRNARRPSVIMIQSDHGHGRFGLNPPPLDAIPAPNVAERLDVLAAYHLPGAPPGLVHDSIGSVNAMRAIMRHYFGADLPPLVDASYWSDGSRPYRLTPVR